MNAKHLCKTNVWLMLVTLALVTGSAIPTGAAVLKPGATPVVSVQNPPFSFHPSDGSPDAHPYRESTLTYKSTPVVSRTFWFVTQDLTYAALDGTSVVVEFNPTTHTGGVIPTPGGPLSPDQFLCTVIYLAGGSFTGSQIVKANGTVFVDPGTYLETTGGYTAISGAANFALVGLTDPHDTGMNPAIIKKASSGSAGAGRLERYQINANGIIYYNLIFDADGKYVMQDSTRGEHFFSIPRGSSYNFLMKNCILQNNVATSLGNNPNRAFNIVGGTGGGGVAGDPGYTVNNSQINLEDITVRAWDANPSFATLTLNQSSNLNIKNLNVAVKTAGSVGCIRIEHPTASTSGSPAGQDLQRVDVRFAGDVTLTSDATGQDIEPAIVLQSNAYGNITLPSSLKFAEFRGGSANGTGETSNGGIRLFKNLPAPASVANNRVLFDLRDSTWLVRQGATPTTQPTVANQLQSINLALQRMAQPQSTNTAYTGNTGQGYNGRALHSNAFIKVLADSNGYVPTFTAPSFASSFALSSPSIHIRAIPSTNVLFGDTPVTSSLVPVAPASSFSLAGPNNANVRLYGFDFAGQDADDTKNAYYTEQEAVAGSPLGTASAPVVAGSSAATFEACRFTGLAQSLDLTAPVIAESTYTAKVGSADFTAQAELRSAYTSVETSGLVSSTFGIDDTFIYWTSSNPAVASVDATSGVVHILGSGVATITATARDLYNEGEISRPFTWFKIRTTNPTIIDPPTIIDDTKVTVIKTPTPPVPKPLKPPKAGDTTSIALWVAIIAATGTGAFALQAKKKQGKND